MKRKLFSALSVMLMVCGMSIVGCAKEEEPEVVPAIEVLPAETIETTEAADEASAETEAVETATDEVAE